MEIKTDTSLSLLTLNGG